MAQAEVALVTRPAGGSTEMAGHPERSEGSATIRMAEWSRILRSAQDDHRPALASNPANSDERTGDTGWATPEIEPARQDEATEACELDLPQGAPPFNPIDLVGHLARALP